MEINRFPMRLKGVFRQMMKTPGLYGLIHNIVKAAIESNMNAHLNNNPTMLHHMFIGYFFILVNI